MRFKRRSGAMVAVEYGVVAVLMAACRFFVLGGFGALVYNIALGVSLLISFTASFRKPSLGVAAAVASGGAMALYALIASVPGLLPYSLVYFLAGLIIPIMLRAFENYSRYLTVIWTVMARFVFLWLMAALAMGIHVVRAPATVGWSELALSLMGGFLAILISVMLERRYPSEF